MEIKIYDLTGALIVEELLTASQDQKRINTASFSGGLYIVHINYAGRSFSKKVVVKD